MYQNLIALCFAIPYWIDTKSFSIIPLLYGGLAAVFDCIGMNCHGRALQHGPAGPVSAMIGISSVFTTIVQAFRYQRMLTLMEFIGIALGTIGSLVIAIPEWFEKFLCGKLLKKQ